MPKNKTEKPKYFASVQLHVELYVPIKNVSSLSEALTAAETIDAYELWQGKVEVDDTWDADVHVSSVSGPDMKVVTG